MRLDRSYRRFPLYAALGVLLGLVGWYTPALVSALGGLPVVFRYSGDISNPWVQAALAWPIYLEWLLPAILAAAIEMRRSALVWRSALAAVVVWASGVVAYHAWWALLLALGLGGPQLPVVRFDAGWTAYRHDLAQLRSIFGDVRDRFVFWGTVAVVGGAMVGLVVGSVVKWIGPGAGRVRNAPAPGR